MEEERKTYHITVEVREVEAEPRNSTARGALGLALCGIVAGGIPWVGWPYLVVSLIVAIVALRSRPRGMAVAALAIDCLLLWVKWLIATT